MDVLLENLKLEISYAIAEADNCASQKLKNMLTKINGLVHEMEEIRSDSEASALESKCMEQDEAEFLVDQDELGEEPWHLLGQGSFSFVFKAKLKGCDVAVKVLKETDENDGALLATREGRLLCRLHHDNIIAFRGTGRLKSKVFDCDEGSDFIVMEFMSFNLKKYMQKYSTYERQGLPKNMVWEFAEQIAHGLEYLHTLDTPIAHRDLKPDNILLDQVVMKIKLADFGVACQRRPSGNEYSLANLRWAPPEVLKSRLATFIEEESEDEFGCDEALPEKDQTDSEEFDEESDEQIDYLKVDMFAFGAVIAYCLTGSTPWPYAGDTASIEGYQFWDESRAKIKIPDSIKETDPLRRLIEHCYNDDAHRRPPSATEAVRDHFAGVRNPYQSIASKAEFFSCGFLKDTKIFVADSIVDENSNGYLGTNTVPVGYPTNSLLCRVDVSKEKGDYVPAVTAIDYEDENEETTTEESWDDELNELYTLRRAHFLIEAKEKRIENNPAIQLKHLVLLREGEAEEQALSLEFVQGTYVHHRAMRDVWMSLDENKKEESTPYKGIVHPVFSTSFGLHVAVVTADNKFFFCRRSNRTGIASPKEYTCGAVESASVKDYIMRDKQTYVSLLRTAARGLNEELRVELVGDEINAICLQTVYLKYDTHEWGMCGFLDLSDPRIALERRLTCRQLQSRFVGGPKDKFEHDLVEAVDFNLEVMVDFVFRNRFDFASSGKLVVVKVLQAFFGVARVEHAFQKFEKL